MSRNSASTAYFLLVVLLNLIMFCSAVFYEVVVPSADVAMEYDLHRVDVLVGVVLFLISLFPGTPPALIFCVTILATIFTFDPLVLGVAIFLAIIAFEALIFVVSPFTTRIAYTDLFSFGCR